LLFIGDVKGINVAADQCERFYFGLAKSPFNGRRIADFNFVKSYVT
jgi:hypothetical protein